MHPDDIFKQFGGEFNQRKSFNLKHYLNRSLFGGVFMLFLAVSVVVVSTNFDSIRVLLSSKASGADVVIDKAVTDRILADGKVDVLVKFNTSFFVETSLSDAQKNTQRQGIQTQKAQILSGLSGLSYKVRQEYKTIPWVAMEVSTQALLKLQSMKGSVLQIVEDQKMEILSIENPPVNYKDIDAGKAWQSGYNGVGTTVAVIDSSFVPESPMFKNLVVTEVCLFDCPNGTSFQVGPGVSKKCEIGGSECAHGSRVAQIISSVYDSVTQGSKLIFLSTYGKCQTATCDLTPGNTSTTMAALEWIYDNRNTYHIDAVNISLGTQADSNSYCDSVYPGKEIFDNLYAANIPVVVASGNHSSTDKISALACIEKAISAGGGTNSKYGPISIWGEGNRASYHKNMLMGPADKVQLLNPYDFGPYYESSGTSIAAPHITGAFAVLKKAYPKATIDDLVKALQETGLPLIDNESLAGITTYKYIQLNKAIDYLKTVTGSTTFGSGNSGLVTSWTNNPGTLPTQPSGYSNIALVTASYRAHNNLDALISSISYCGKPMSRIGGTDAISKRKHQDQNVEMWYLMTPPSGSCEVKATFNKEPEDRIIAASIVSGVQVSNFLESYNFAGYDYPPGSNYLLLSKAGPKDSKFVCTYSTYPNSSLNKVITAGSKWTQLWSSGYVTNAKNVQAGIGISDPRAILNEISQIRWNSTQVYPWSALCINLRMKPTSSTPPPATPAPIPSVDLKINGTNGPVLTDGLTPITISWTSSYITSCSASGGWTGTKASIGSESKLANRTNKFSIFCTGPNSAQVSDAVQLNIDFSKSVCFDKAIPSGVDFTWLDRCRGVFSSYTKNLATNKYYCPIEPPPVGTNVLKTGSPYPTQAPYSFILDAKEALQYYAWKDAGKPKTPCYGLLFM